MKVIIVDSRNIFLSIILLIAIVFSVMTIVQATTPNPGHSITQIDFPVVTKTADATLTDSERYVLADATSAAFTITLPTAVQTQPYAVFVIKKIDSSLANLVTIDANSTETIDGMLTIILSQRGESVTLISDGSNWRALWSGSYDFSAYRSKGSTLDQWYAASFDGSTPLTTGAPSINNLRAVPVIFSKVTTIDQMAINVTTLSAGMGRIGIYRDNGNNYPGTLVVESTSATQLNLSTTGVKTATDGLPVTLQPGLYWFVYVSNVSATIRGLQINSPSPILGFASTLPTNAQFGWIVAYNYAALPSTFTAGGTAITAVPIPAIYYRTSQ